MPGGVSSENEARVSRSPISRSRLICMQLPSGKWVTIPVFVDQVLGGGFAQGAEPLRAVGRHPDKVSGLDRVPVVSETVDATAFEHEQAVLHDVNFDQGERGAGLITHGVYGVVQARHSGQ